MPTAEEVQNLIGIDLYADGIQPVWIEVENRDSAPYWFLPHGMDPNYFPHWEAAEAFTRTVVRGQRLDRRDSFKIEGIPGLKRDTLCTLPLCTQKRVSLCAVPVRSSCAQSACAQLTRTKNRYRH